MASKKEGGVGVRECMDSEGTQHPGGKSFQGEKIVLKEIPIASYGYGAT